MGRALVSLTGLRVAGMVIVLAYNVLLARLAGPEAFGLVALYANVCIYGAVLLSGGLETAVVRYGSLAWASGDAGVLAAIYRQATRHVLGRTALLVVAAVLAMTAGVTTPITVSPELASLTLGGIWLCAMNAIHRDVLRATDRLAMASVSQSIVRSIVPLVLLLALSPLVEIDATMHVAIYGAALLAGFLIEILVIWPHMKGVPVEPAAVRAERIHFARRVFVGDVAHVAIYRMPSLAVGLAFDLKTAALFFAAERFAALSQFVVEGVQLAAGRDAALHFAGRDPARMQEMVSRISLYAVITGVPIVLALAMLGPFLLGLFGPEFGDAYAILLCLLAGYAAMSVFGPTPILCSMAGLERERAAISYAVLGASVVAILIAAATASLLHFAGAVALSLWLLHGVAAILLWRRTGAVAGIVGLRSSHFMGLLGQVRIAGRRFLPGR